MSSPPMSGVQGARGKCAGKTDTGFKRPDGTEDLIALKSLMPATMPEGAADLH